MVASKHTRPSASPGYRARGSATAGDGFSSGPYSVERLLSGATGLRLWAPEVAMVLGERAVALAESAGSDELWVRAEALVVSARVRLGDRAATVARAVVALRAAEAAGDRVLAAGIRTDLAICARSVGAPLSGLAVLRPALAVPGQRPAERAAAMVQLVGCLAQFGRKPELDRALREADRLCSDDEGLDPDARLVVRALLRVAISAHRRRHGDLTGAADAARTGLGLLEQLENPGTDGGLAQVRLVLQLVATLLDRGDTELAMELAQPVLDAPARAACIAPLGWLRLAVATRVLLPSGAGAAATTLLRAALHDTERHGLRALTARLWLELSSVEEQVGSAADAIDCLRQARTAEQIYGRQRRQACGVLAAEFGSGEQAPLDVAEVLEQSPPAPARQVERQPEPAPAMVAEPVAERFPVTAVPELKLAPAPAAEPAPQVAWAREPEPAPKVTRSTAPEPAPEVAWSREPAAEVHWSREPSPAPQVSWSRETAPAPEVAWSREAAPEVSWTREAAPAAEVNWSREARSAPQVDWSREAAPAEEVSWSRELAPPPSAPEPAEPAPVARDTSDDWWERRSYSEPAAPAQRTRHDSEHGSVAAKSVLDRLGISAGSGGGRRRATDGVDPGAPAEEKTPRSKEAAEFAELAEFTAPEPVAPRREPDPPETPQPSGDHERPVTESERTSAVGDDWLPRLRLPPSLAPLEELNGSSASAEPSWGSGATYQDNDFGQPFGADYAKAISADEPPPDAGLAELLARALAEHQAGTSSAAALVKRLGSQSDHGDPRPVNGHGRGHGSGYDGRENGLHRDGF
ncbi:hypothetical protein [Amycolatopsis nigrescens]|uniref:hypothetical protein n=1 Tax=Amycolatopsis nigrescens TaxID=381445 RepID=UPI00035D3C02|nr:hypothetical protein [Amycolatopsis nigrescens]